MINRRIIYWIAGTLTAFGGVLVVRVLAGGLPGNEKVIATLTGYTLSFLGLFVISMGTRRKN